MSKNVNVSPGLILAVIFASAVISGSLVYFGMQMNGSGTGGGMLTDEAFAQKIEEGIENYAEKQIEEQQAAMEAQEKSAGEKAKNVSDVSNEDHVYGNADAKVTLVEYSDFKCPYCARFHATAKQIVDEYDGQVNWVYRHFPLAFHNPLATDLAHASECVAELAGNDAFWNFTDKVFEAGSTIAGDSDIEDLAVSLGVSAGAFNNCMDSEKYLDKIQEDMKNGTEAGVTGTPGNIVVNNDTGDAVGVSGARPIDSFRPVIDELLGN